jgi:hypothetical protein
MDQQTGIAETRQDTTETRSRRFSHRQYLRLSQHRLPGEFNRSTRGGRRAAALVTELQATLGIETPTEVQAMALHRAAILQSLAEDALLRRVNGDTSITHKDVLWLNASAEKALRALGIRAKVEPPKPPGPTTLAAYLASRYGDGEAAP